MASFKRHRSCANALLAGFFVLGCSVMLADAQQQPSGFAVERLYQSAPGGGWFVMDDLDMTGRLGGAVSLTSGYARNPLWSSRVRMAHRNSPFCLKRHSSTLAAPLPMIAF